MTTKRIAAVALAASAIIAQAPASAEVVKHDRGFNSPLLAFQKARAVKAKKTSRFVGHQNLRLDRRAPLVRTSTFRSGFGYSPYFVAQLKRQALGACSAQLRHDAYQFGYKGASLSGADVKQVGKDRFIVHAGAKLYDGYSFSHESYNCTVSHGRVIDAYKPKKLNF